MRQAAQQRREGEYADSQQEDPPVAIGLAEPGTGDQQDGEGDQVTADDQLQHGARGTQIGVDRRRGDVGDGGVGKLQAKRVRPPLIIVGPAPAAV